MGLVNPAPGVVDFGSFRALQPLYDAAKAAGIWIVLRPGERRLDTRLDRPSDDIYRTSESS
jgi:beta-galactosidase GanA